MENYQRLEQELSRITHIRNIGMLAHWDAATGLPKESVASRNEEIATFSTVVHEMSTSEKVGQLIEASQGEVDYLDEWQKSNLTLTKKSYDRETAISSDIQHEFSIASSASEFAWRQARANNDFKSLIPHLDRVFNVVRKIADLQSQKLKKSSMDVLIDSFDPGRTSLEIGNVFNVLKAQLPELTEKIIQKQKGEKIIPLSKPINEETQKLIGLKIMEVMEFNMDRGRLDKSVHPFCIGSNDDVRLTTRYDENNFISSLFGVIHETGHGLYQQNLPAQYRNQPVGGPLGMAFHESQSLIMEMQAGTSREFTQFLAKLLRDHFTFSGPEYSEENLYKLVTKVKPSFIRVDADEVTYPMHIILRFEIEKAILEDNLKAQDLPGLWNSKMQQYLGIIPNANSEGCMQDIHWPSGWLGYFPSYTNGAIIASMLMRSAKDEYSEIGSELDKGNFQSLNKYLNDNLRQYGSSKSSADLLKASTGYDSVQPGIFIDYLQDKYL
ncbi:MAG: carboxypeptidase M32 [Rickettsiaceae bacterium]|nr:carboxypeptidase M32 [Rickettsiaceae bacterium]